MEIINKFVNIDIVEYECSVCKTYDHTLCGVVGCMHPVCKECIEKCKKITMTGNIYECPVCRNRFSRYETNHILNRQRNNIIVKCQNGCKDAIYMNEYSKHLSSCMLSMVNCYINECEWKGLRKDFYQHIKECPFIKIECSYCKNNFYRDCILSHEQLCKQYYEVIVCDKCKRNIMRWNIKYHVCNLNKDVIEMEYPSEEIFNKNLTEESFIDLLTMIFIDETKYGISKMLKKNIKTLTKVLWCIDYCINNYHFDDEYNDLVIKYINEFWSCIHQRHYNIKEEIILRILEEHESRFLSKDRYFYAEQMKKLIILESSC